MTSRPSSLPVGEPVETRDAAAPSAAPLEGRFVRLVPAEAAHAPALFAGSHGDAETERLWTYLPYGPFASEEEMRGWLERITASTDPHFFTVLDLPAERPVGMVSYLNIVAADRRIELGHIWYVPAAQRGRANTESTYLLMRRAFDELGYRRVEWKCDALNARSRSAAERLGFTFEGVFRQHMIVKGRNRDTTWYAITNEEWRARREAIEHWLAADDPASVSLRSLTAGL